MTSADHAAGPGFRGRRPDPVRRSPDAGDLRAPAAAASGSVPVMTLVPGENMLEIYPDPATPPRWKPSWTRSPSWSRPGKIKEISRHAR